MQGEYGCPTPDYQAIVAEAFCSALHRQQRDQELTKWLDNIRQQQAVLAMTAPVAPVPEVVVPAEIPVPQVQAPVLKHPSEVTVSLNGKRGKPRARFEKKTTPTPEKPQHKKLRGKSSAPGKPQNLGSVPGKPPLQATNPPRQPPAPGKPPPQATNPPRQPPAPGKPPPPATNPQCQSSGPGKPPTLAPMPRAPNLQHQPSAPGMPPPQATQRQTLNPEKRHRQAACRTWNNGERCRYTPCKFRHDCDRCGSAAHPRVHHDRAIPVQLAQRA